MGYMRHNAIVVTSFKREYATELYGIANAIFGNHAVTAIMTACTNGYYTFFVGPDGSKEGWCESEEGDNRRDEFVAQLRAAYERGVYCQWAELQYGDDERETKIIRSSDGDCEE